MNSTPAVEPGKVAFADVPPNRRRGGDLRVLLSPRTCAATAGFLGAGSLMPGEFVSEHYHPYSEEYFYIVSGRMTLRLEGRPIELVAGDSFMIPKGLRHRMDNHGDEEMFAVFFLGPLAPKPELGHVDTEELPSSGGELPQVGAVTS
ncbi:cupin domain-containing protein [Kitasatospora sp. NPDC093558]|uniref:cupin domain-containing protein n=1 Tax=Kitasatospora sp. NPDC093558 TaxID=3155201 RepID=UPI003440D69E